MEQQQFNARLQNNPQDYIGNAGNQYFEMGGPLATKYLKAMKAYGGSVNQLSSDGVEFKGNSHEKGGIKLPDINTEVEGNETAKGSYVFSDALGFAKLHKPLMRIKGKVEGKPATPERLNTLRVIEGHENRLKIAQEQLKKSLNIQ